MFWYLLLILAVGVERIAELIVARRNLARSLARGGHEVGFAQYPFMVALHAGLLAGAVAEVWFGDRPFLPWLGWPMLAVVVAAQGLRWWCIRTLGSQWNTRIVVVPGAPRITSGPYRWLRHPNYVAVVAEGVALPLVHTAWITALTFTVLNAAVLTVRIRVEDAALGELARADA